MSDDIKPISDFEVASIKAQVQQNSKGKLKVYEYQMPKALQEKCAHNAAIKGMDTHEFITQELVPRFKKSNLSPVDRSDFFSNITKASKGWHFRR